MFPKKQIEVFFWHYKVPIREEEGVYPQDSQGESREERDCRWHMDFSDG